jgi:ATP-dependent RNA helicase DeaD
LFKENLVTLVNDTAGWTPEQSELNHALAAAPGEGDSFQSLGLPQNLLRALAKLEFARATPVQAQAIPPALAGRDVLALAGTGTGKTLAFGLPIIAKLSDDPDARALILAPTRELAAQVMTALRAVIGERSPLMSTLVIGGEPMGKQIAGLRRRPQLIVGTPGRINDHLLRGSIDLSGTGILVLDEVDKMLDMGFDKQVQIIASKLPAQRQTLLFSATLPPHIAKFANGYVRDAARVSVASAATAPVKIDQKVRHIEEAAKFAALCEALDEREGSVILFVKTKIGAEKIARRLGHEGHLVDALHGDLHQSRRARVTAGFRRGDFRVLVATDVAARGLDVPHIEHVINYHLPQVAEDYLHRIGRTGRAGASGHALTFVSSEEQAQWRAIDRLLNPGQPKESRIDYAKPKGNRRTARRNAKRSMNEQAAHATNGWTPMPKPDREERRDDRRDDRRDVRGGGERRPARPAGERFSSDRPRGERPSGERPRGERPQGERMRSERPHGERMRSERPQGERPQGERPRGARPGDQRRSGGQRAQGGKRGGRG